MRTLMAQFESGVAAVRVVAQCMMLGQGVVTHLVLLHHKEIVVAPEVLPVIIGVQVVVDILRSGLLVDPRPELVGLEQLLQYLGVA